MTVSILVPFRSDGADRDRIWSWMRERWQQAFPNAEIVVCDDGGTAGAPFNEGRAWNRCLAEATGDILVVTESEVAFNTDPLTYAVARCERSGAWFLPARYYQLNREHTQNLLRYDQPTVPLGVPDNPERVFDGESVSPVWVLPRRALEAIGGFDEGWDGWGWIDRATVAALSTLYRPYERFPGSVYHLWHERDGVPKDSNPGLTERYLLAHGNTQEMRALIWERVAA